MTITALNGNLLDAPIHVTSISCEPGRLGRGTRYAIESPGQDVALIVYPSDDLKID